MSGGWVGVPFPRVVGVVDRVAMEFTAPTTETKWRLLVEELIDDGKPSGRKADWFVFVAGKELARGSSHRGVEDAKNVAEGWCEKILSESLASMRATKNGGGAS